MLKVLSIFARHGLFDAEAELGQRFFIDVEICKPSAPIEAIFSHTAIVVERERPRMSSP